MPNRAQRRSGELEAIKFKVTVDGNPYEISLADVSAKDEFDYYQATGQTFMDLFTGKTSAFGVAGLVWVYRRRWEKKLTFDEVLREFKLSDLESVDFGEDDDDKTEAEVSEPAYNGKNPEPSGGPSASTSLGSPLSTS